MFTKLIPSSHLRGTRGFLFLLMSLVCTTLKPVLGIEVVSAEQGTMRTYSSLNSCQLEKSWNTILRPFICILTLSFLKFTEISEIDWPPYPQSKTTLNNFC